YLDRFPAIADSKRRTYAAMLSAMDDGVGAVIRELKNAGLYRDTLVLFLSDNGGPSSGNASSNAPLSGVKGTVLEGGIRVPFILQWPRRVRGGRTYGHPVTALDILPTAAAAGGGALRGGRAIDGVNLIPHITGEKSQPPHDVLFWRFGAPRAVRRGEWKLIAPTDQPPRLYNLTEDIGETDDRAEREPGVVASLAKSLAAWESQLSEPLWQRSRRRRQRAVTGRAR
ncbi:MAG: sulfatase-like hydrolase/transferase, partial [Armatimonadota bacterium]